MISAISSPLQNDVVISRKTYTQYYLFILFAILLITAWFLRSELNLLVRQIRSEIYLNIAKRLIDENRPDAALQNLKLSTTYNPSNINSWKIIAKLSNNRDDQLHIEALYVISELSSPDSSKSVEFLRLARVKGQLQIAVPHITALINRFPNDPQIYYESALILTSLGMYSSALQLLNSSLLIKPSDEKVKIALYSLLLVNNDQNVAQMAASRLESTRIQDPELAKVAKLNLINYYTNKNPEHAAHLVSEYLSADPASWELRLLQIDLAYRNAEEELPDLIAKAFEYAKTQPHFSSLLARVAEYENTDTALKMLDSLRQNTFTPADKILIEMPIHWAAQNYEKIISLAEQAPQSAPPSILSKISIWKLRALAASEASEPFKISAHIDQILKNFSQRPQLLLEMSQTLRDWGLHNQARPLLQRLADSRGPYAFHALIHLYEIAQSGDDTPALFQITQSLLELQPDNPVLQFNFAALALELGINLPQAEKIASSLYQKHPVEPGIVHLYAQALAANGKQQQALEIYDSIPAEKLISSPILKPYETLLINNLGLKN